MKNIANLFDQELIKDGDYFLYTDAWNPTVIQLKYMSELLGIKIKIGGMWHAGSYDPEDFLGRLIGDAPWIRHAEKSMFECFDDNFFATQFHIDMFCVQLFSAHFSPQIEERNKILRVGWPMDYMEKVLAPYKGMEKENLVLFPHRIAPEKQVDIFRDLAKEFPDYEFIVCQEQQLTKHEYHTLLGKAKMVFSANLQETLGITCYEGALLGAIPVVPDRLSYTEMYDPMFKYPSEWTESVEAYKKHKPELVKYLKERLDANEYLAFVYLIDDCKELEKQFFSGEKLYKIIEEHSK